MNTFQFLELLYGIFGKKKPDLKKIEKKGLLAVKIAQHFALRVDFLDPAVCQKLSLLFRRSAPLSEKDQSKRFNEILPENFFKAFKSFEKTPFASASVGQAHRAVLKNGQKTVVKIIKVSQKEKFLNDIRKLKNFFHFILFFYPKLHKVADPLGILDYIKSYTLSELHLLDEIRGKETLEKIHKFYYDRFPLDKLIFTRHYPDLSNENVLTADEVEGESFDELLSQNRLPYLTLLNFFEIHGFFLFVAGTFHGDIHPGNIIYTKDKKICLIDTGAVSRAGFKVRNSLFYFMEALIYYRFEKAAEFLNQMSLNELKGKKQKKFLQKFLKLYDDFPGKTVQEVSLTKKMMTTIKLGVNSGMEFEKGLFAIIKSMMYLDGMVLRCRPDINLMTEMRPYIDRFKKIIESEKPFS